MLKRYWVAGLAAMWLAVPAFSQQKTLSGYLIDRACSADAVKKGEKAAKEHGLDCALMEDCAKSGFGVYTADGKFLTFDAAGNKRALAALKASKKKADLQVTVTGEVSGDTVKVASLKLS